mmetsp:Transcript_41189/g.108834  ORF Transcript_41189/g.108834 Transcript_41189/m.108834 type:complete len:89 (-) Transcript_41189:226-492(-)
MIGAVVHARTTCTARQMVRLFGVEPSCHADATPGHSEACQPKEDAPPFTNASSVWQPPGAAEWPAALPSRTRVAAAATIGLIAHHPTH